MFSNTLACYTPFSKKAENNTFSAVSDSNIHVLSPKMTTFWQAVSLEECTEISLPLLSLA